MLRRIFSNNLLDEIRKLRTERRDVRREHPLEISIDESASRLELGLATVQSTLSQKVNKSSKSSESPAIPLPTRTRSVQPTQMELLQCLTGLAIDRASGLPSLLGQ